jgi:hypothetical protein
MAPQSLDIAIWGLLLLALGGVVAALLYERLSE